MSNANTFFNFMQAWNSEIQTSQLRKLNDSLASNVSSLSNLKASGGDVENRAASLKLAKDALFSARKMIEEIEENLEKEPEVSLFLYHKVIDGMKDIKDTDFDDFSDKEYFLTCRKKFYACGESLKNEFGSEYIQDLKHWQKISDLHQDLHYFGFLKELDTYIENRSFAHWFFGVNIKELHEGIKKIATKWRGKSAGKRVMDHIKGKDPRVCLPLLARETKRLEKEIPEYNMFEVGDCAWTDISVGEIQDYIETIEERGEIVVQITRLRLGVQLFQPLGAGLSEKPLSA